MSISQETAMQHKNDPAVTCCRFEAGGLVEASSLEDPTIFPDLEDSGLLDISDDTLTIGEVLGAKLKETVDSLTPLTKDLLEDLPEVPAEEEAQEVVEDEAQAAMEVTPVAAGAHPVVTGYATLKIEKGENIEISFPVYG